MASQPDAAPRAILELRGVTRRFGGLVAVDRLDLEVPEGCVFGLIGPNGAGKTTVFNVITGASPASEGHVLFGGHDVTAMQPYAISRAGVARTFQNIRLFRGISVLENVKTAMSWRAGYGWWDGLVQGVRFERRERALLEECMELLGRSGLERRAPEMAGSLPYGEQRRLEIVRALATHPRLLLLDEPAAGLNHTETDELMGFVRATRGELGLTVLLIEHDMRMVMGICERIAVLDHGEKISEGSADEVRRDARVVAAYLGEEPVEGAEPDA
jgi:branched-chain amino acid transport system ATP-binding protein